MATYGVNQAGGWDFTTLAAALAAVANGSQLEFAPGVHAVVGTSHTKTGLIYRPYTDGQVWSLVRSTGSGPAVLFYTGADIDGGSGRLTISGGTNGLEGNGTSRLITLRRTRVTGNTGIGLYRPATGSTIVQCEFDNNGTLGVSVISSQVVAVTASKFWANQNDGFNGAGCAVSRSSFHGNNAGGVGTAQCNLGTTGAAVEVFAEGGGLIGIRGTSATRCSASGNAGADYDVATNTSPITGPVGFINAAVGNLGILKTSPAFHLGVPSAVVTDFAGNAYDPTNPTPGALEVEDPDPPVVEITSPAGAVVEAYTLTGTYTDASDVTGLTYQIDSEDPVDITPIASPFSVPLTLTPGEHTITVTAVDEFDNEGTDSVEVDVDSDNPVVTITSPAGSTVPEYTLTGTVTDASEVTSLEYRVDGGAWVAMTPGAAFAADFILPVGLTLFEVRATDIWGNTATAELTVGYQPPVTQARRYVRATAPEWYMRMLGAHRAAGRGDGDGSDG